MIERGLITWLYGRVVFISHDFTIFSECFRRSTPKPSVVNLRPLLVAWLAGTPNQKDFSLCPPKRCVYTCNLRLGLYIRKVYKKGTPLDMKEAHPTTARTLGAARSNCLSCRCLAANGDLCTSGTAGRNAAPGGAVADEVMFFGPKLPEDLRPAFWFWIFWWVFKEIFGDFLFSKGNGLDQGLRALSLFDALMDLNPFSFSLPGTIDGASALVRVVSLLFFLVPWGVWGRIWKRSEFDPLVYVMLYT